MANDASSLRLYNTLTRSKDVFTPIDPENVRMYVCGPTVYDFAHIGNARPVIVFDVLFRLLRHLYGADHVTYVRNITDVDDKINARAARDFPTLPLNDAIRAVTEKTAAQFESDVAALGCLKPTVEPRATDNIEGMQTLIAELLQNGHAYAAAGEVLFDTVSMPDYGRLSRRPLDEQQAGARIAVDAHKKNPADFVLWKQSSAEEPGWESPWGRGRPGWHIECSAMSERYLGQTFDIHGGGLDLIFPHHENEIAQSRCAHGTEAMANVWMHNGFVQVEGRKMSKSDGNFVTINELLETEKFGGHSWTGSVLRLAMLMTHYTQPIDWTVTSLNEASGKLGLWAGILLNSAARHEAMLDKRLMRAVEVPEIILAALVDDLNSPRAVVELDEFYKKARTGDEASALALMQGTIFLGLLDPDRLLLHANAGAVGTGARMASPDALRVMGEIRTATANNATARVETLTADLANQGLVVTMRVDGGLSYHFAQNSTLDWQGQIDARLAALNARDFARADAIRAELLAQGIQLMDYKDPATGERRTKWEVKR